MNSPLRVWTQLPLYLRIVTALLLGFAVGAALYFSGNSEVAKHFETPAKMILRLLGMLAPPLILVAVVNALLHTDIQGKTTGRLAGLLVLNTVVAILIGLLVANVLRPGVGANLAPPAKPGLAASESDPEKKRILETMEAAGFKAPPAKKDPLTQFLESVPSSIGGPLVENNVIGVILLALGFGIALRPHRDRSVRNVGDFVEVALQTLLTLLHWVLQVIPLGVFGIVVAIVGDKGFGPFLSLGKYVVTVLVGLLLQASWYLLRIKFGSWVTPLGLLRGCRDALVTAFSTDSSTATMPVNFDCLRHRVGLRERSASLGALVGSNFNNDGTALYEAVSALFIAQMVGQQLGFTQQVLVVLMSIVASVGAAGIPEAGLVTMTLVFAAVGLDPRYIPLLLTVDWFLDRCRTCINVMGDMNVSCLLDGKTREVPELAVAADA